MFALPGGGCGHNCPHATDYAASLRCHAVGTARADSGVFELLGVEHGQGRHRRTDHEVRHPLHPDAPAAGLGRHDRRAVGALGREKPRRVRPGFGDFFAFFIAVGLQVATIIVYHAQGNDIGKTFGFSVPDVAKLTNLAEPYGILGVAGLQGGAFLFYWFADPDPKTEDDD